MSTADLASERDIGINISGMAPTNNPHPSASPSATLCPKFTTVHYLKVGSELTISNRMGTVISADEGVVMIALLLVGLYIAYAMYKTALPCPLPDIPYNRDAAHKLLGDVPEMVGYVMRTKRIFVSSHC